MRAVVSILFTKVRHVCQICYTKSVNICEHVATWAKPARGQIWTSLIEYVELVEALAKHQQTLSWITHPVANDTIDPEIFHSVLWFMTSSTNQSTMQRFSSCLRELVNVLPPRPITKDSFDALVSAALAQAEQQSSSESRKANWEFALKDDIFNLAATEGQALKDPSTSYYADLRDRLDIILTFTEHNACEQIFPFNVLYDLLETQTIHSCSHIFSWIEARADRLTEGMVSQKGKALVLLRTLNDLLRRLSKMGATTRFCGRILTFLSSVFPLGERSGVNLRGEFGPVWEGPGLKTTEKEQVEKSDESQATETDKMQVDEKAEITEAKDGTDDFYHVFWSLQLPFSRPPLFSEPQTLPQFKLAVNRVLPVIKEATVRERALMGSKNVSGNASLKRKRNPETVPGLAGTEYFFAKYLTSPDLLELEIADTHFRRQFLFQLLVLLHHLLAFTKVAKAEWATPRNRSLHIDFTLEPADAQWVMETITRANEELRQTSPNGRAFSETVNVILEREKNWVKWKNELCAPFDKEAWSIQVEVESEDGSRVKKKAGLEEATKEARLKMCEDPPEWKHSYGTAPLTEIWEMGYRDLRDLQHPFYPGEVTDFVKKVKVEDNRIASRKQMLTQKAKQIAAARARAALAATPVQDLPTSPLPVSTPSASQDSNPAAVSTPPTVPRAVPPNTPPLHHPLPAKPVTTPVKLLASVPQPPETAPAAPVTPTPVARVSTPAPASPAPESAPVVLHPDEFIMRAEENKQRLSWLALRAARDQYLQHFGKIGTGDIVLLAHEIERAKEVKEQEERAGARAESEAITLTSQEERVISPMIGSVSSQPTEVKADQSGMGVANGKDTENDTVMES